MTYIVFLKSGRHVYVTAPDADVALYRAKRYGWDAVSARPTR